MSPPFEDLDQLSEPPGDSVVAVARFFDRLLKEPWEIYIRPYLNGLRPDIVLLHPAVGIGVYHVVDWDLTDKSYRVDVVREGSPPVVLGRSPSGDDVQLQNPIDSASTCQWEIYNLYCPRLTGPKSLATITSGIVCTQTTRVDAERFFEQSFVYRGMNAAPRYHPIAGAEELTRDDLLGVFPEAGRVSSRHMDATRARDLRNWLSEPDFAKEQRRPLPLDSRQRRFVTTDPETRSGYRRMRGPAGSGKSLVLAARAAQLALEGKEVLVVSYNLTLLHYLRDLASRWPHPGAGAVNEITWINFHTLCRRVCYMAGWSWEYRRLWAEAFEEDGVEMDEALSPEAGDAIQAVLEGGLPDLVARVLQSSGSRVRTYDAVLVDEGQDMLPSWWDVLRKVCRPNGEMLLAVDASQDIYGHSPSWTDQVMTDAGFKGRWYELKRVYRLPPKLAELASAFADRYVPDADPPRDAQLTLATSPCTLRWIQTSEEGAAAACVKAVLELPVAAEPSILSFTDIIFLAPSQAVGLEVVNGLRKHRVFAAHTFGVDKKDSRRMKVRFFMDDAHIKATTVHSFKGWEARAVVLYAGSYFAEDTLRLAYTGMTRVRGHEEGSLITVVCAIPELAAHGKTWPGFEIQ